jgi:RHS repeat-associated protein
LFTGREFDEETGIYNYRARYYDSAEGRFLQRDPSEKLFGEDLYAYASDNPVNQTDPSGRDELKLSVKPMGRTTGDCGEYSWRVAWRLNQATKHPKGGWVVQHIQAEIKAEDADENVLDPPASSKAEYWEAWYISSNGISPWRPYDKLWDDKYWATGRGGGTKGTISVEGTAKFYEGLDLPKPPFKKKQGNKGAGNLWVSDEDPKLEGGTAEVKHNLKAKWDCLVCFKEVPAHPVLQARGIKTVKIPIGIPNPKTKILSTDPAK